MNESRVIKAAVEVWNSDRLSVDSFLHYAYIAKLVPPDRYREWRKMREKQNADEIGKVGAIAVDAVPDSVWSSQETPAGEASYVLNELRIQLRQAIFMLYAFQDEIDSECEALERPSFPDDAHEVQLWANRSRVLSREDISNVIPAVFPRTYHEYLVVPAPPEGAEE
jgi:hypothetical protein